MRILAIGSTYDLPELHIFAGLAASGYTVHAVVSAKSRLRHELEAAGIVCHELDFRSRLDLRAIRSLRNILGAGRYDVLHCLTARAVSNTLIASWGLPGKIVAYRGTSGRDSKFSPASWMSFLHPKVKRIICVSDAVRQFMSGMVRPEKLVTIYKGHDTSWYRPRADMDLGAYGVPRDAYVVACVANLRPVKGVKFLLEAMRLLVAKGDEDTHLVLIGEMRAESNLEILRDAEVAARLHAVGYQSDVASFVARSNVFVLPSIEREGLPKAMLEAMSLGLPVIVTNVGGMPEVVTDQENGLVIPPSSADAIARAIERVKQDPELAKRLGEAAKRTIQETFTVQRAVQETAAVYDSLGREEA